MKAHQAGHTLRLLIGQLIVLAGIFELFSAEVVEVCISEEFRASCPLDRVILINSAEYGRMEVGRCIRKPDEFLGCTNDV
ncbi:hypothetical protein LSH36_2027g00029, partial [Paralvinella palmiformis]